MGSQSTPNNWFSKGESFIKNDSKLLDRYMNDILKSIHESLVDSNGEADSGGSGGCRGRVLTFF